MATLRSLSPCGKRVFLLTTDVVFAEMIYKFSSAPSHDHKVFRLVNLRLRTQAVPSSLLFARDYKVTAEGKFDKPRSGLAVYKCTIQQTGEYVVFSKLQIKSMMNKVKDEQN